MIAPVSRADVLADRAPPAAAIEAVEVSHQFARGGSQVEALRNVTISAERGRLVSIVGPSGCGKSTLFNILSGLIAPSAGRVRINGEDVTGTLGLTGYMPQKDLLMPWKRVLDNTTIGLELQGVPTRRARAEARALFPRFGLSGFEHEYPSALSGGMRQRAALLRTVLTRKEILLLDEPFGALDALTRLEMQIWLQDIWSQLGGTVLFVTHDVEEAIFLSDRIYVLSPRPGSVRAVFDVPIPRPRDYAEVAASADFIGLKRRLLGELLGDVLDG